MRPISELPFPDFDDPPVAEVVLAVGFERLPLLTTPELTRFALSMENRYPIIEMQPEVQVLLEAFGAPPTPMEPRLEVYGGAPPTRLWLRNERQTQLIQVQADWFAANWQNAGGTDPYPRFSAVEQFYERSYREFVAFLDERKLGEVAPTQCEVTYVNHIAPGSAWTDHGDVAKVIRLVGATGGDVLSAPETSAVEHSFIIEDPNGLPTGRLRVIARTGFRNSDGVPVVVLTMTARVIPLRDDPMGIMEALRVGHEWVVKGFLDITTDEAQADWGLT